MVHIGDALMRRQIVSKLVLDRKVYGLRCQPACPFIVLRISGALEVLCVYLALLVLEIWNHHLK